jgi:hypothetical protein
MKLWKYGIVVMIVSTLVFSSGVVSAETIIDGQNDILLTTDGGASYQTGITKSEIDVQSVTCTFSGSTVTLVLEIYGTVQGGEGYEYRAVVNTADSRYTMNYNAGMGLCTAYRFDDSDIDPEPVLSVSGSTITTVFNLLGDTTIVDLVGNGALVVGSTEYMDWLPDSEGPSADDEPVEHPDETQTVPDGQNDVLKSIEGTCNFTGNQSKPDIDVKQITCTIEGTTLTLELEIWDDGTIQQVAPYAYYATVNTTDFRYSLGMYRGSDLNMVQPNTGDEYLPDEPELVIGEHTLSAVFEIQGNSTITEIFGHAEYIAPEMYQDWAPDSRGPEGSFGEDIPDDDDNTTDDDTNDNTTDNDTDDNTTDDDTNDNTTNDDTDENNNNTNNNKTGPKKTPGFETIAGIAAISVVFILLKRRRK